MRKTILIMVAAAVALVAAAVAYAAYTASGVSAATATFSTDKVAVRTASCTGADGKAFTVTNGHYTGVASFVAPAAAAELNGPLSIDARTVYSTTDGLGYVTGLFHVRNERPTRLNGHFTATLKGTQLVGFLDASSRGHHARVLGNLSATFTPTTGFTTGLIGSTSSTSVLAVIAGPTCPKPRPEPKPTPAPKRPVHVEGTISAISGDAVGSTVTVTSRGPSAATCTRDATSPATTGFKVGDRVEMGCAYIGTTWTLRELKKHR
jgi:hypothetical protein